MQNTSLQFKHNTAKALKNETLQKTMANSRGGLTLKRAKAVSKTPKFEALRDSAREIKENVLENLDLYLEEFEHNVIENGGHVHWAQTASEARGHIVDICRKTNAKTVTKGKSMISEEIELNDFLEQSGIKTIETDLGEYIVQLRGETPSHIIAPAVHLSMDQVRQTFLKNHKKLKADRDLQTPESLLLEARAILREQFLKSDIGITGANFLVAETGTSVIVTNEGNGDLTQVLPRVHVVIASIEKIVPNLEDMSQLLRVLARSATGQKMSVYNTLSTGSKRADDADGPEEYHVILLDNGRSNMLGTEFHEMLRCIRCGACMNHCPVYQNVGGHAYGSLYTGPMGSVLTPALVGIDTAKHLPNASTFCGRCEEVCPVKIPLPKMMRNWREREFEKHLSPKAQRRNLKLWAYLAKRPFLYRRATQIASFGMRMFSLNKGHSRYLPFAGQWTKHRQMPTPVQKTFMQQYNKKRR
ncbi:MAG: LutB/LldF family L-lactate oxidation iron-sulfur protein [Nitratireductor sp.]